MAATLLARHTAGAVEVRSAGSVPADSINPTVRGVMAEIGIDVSREQPTVLTTEAVQSFDVVITRGCGDAPRPPMHALEQRCRPRMTPPSQ